MDRKVTLDIETSGLYVFEGDQILSVGAVELINNLPTGREKEWIVNPGEKVFYISQESTDIHGLTLEYLRTKPLFQEVAQEILDFLGEDPIVIHNAHFDIVFLRKKFEECGYSLDKYVCNPIICTVELARNILPNSKVNLDSLCNHFGIFADSRDKYHGALKDAKLLAKIFYHLQLIKSRAAAIKNKQGWFKEKKIDDLIGDPVIWVATEEERKKHQEYLKKNL